MADPFEALRLPAAPADPDPAFAARLRARIARALDLPPGVAVSTTSPAPHAPAGPGAPLPPPRGAAIPYLAVAGARRAVDWYVEVFGATVVGEPIVMPDGRIGHAELAVSGGVLYLADAHPEIGVVAPAPEGASVTLVLAVPDVDATLPRLVDAGGRLDRGPFEDYGSRNAFVVDPFGHRWMLQTPLPGHEPARYRHGDLGYASLWVPDVARAAAFYGHVLGWTYAAGDGAGDAGRGRQVRGTTPALGLWAGREPGTLFCCYAVDDVPAALARVAAAGGVAGAPRREPYGVVADCADEAGMPFAVYTPPGGTAGGSAGGSAGGPPANGARAGDLAYLTLQVVDSARARAFYGAVLGWRFAPGRASDGWTVADVAPMTGLSGGHERPAAVPMWRVDDIAAAVRRVREAGGTATEPARQPYGLTAECADEAGIPFWLGQL